MALDRLTQITSSGISSTSTITVSAVAGSITGVVTATSLTVTGNSTATNINASGIVTATGGVVGDVTGDLTGNISGDTTISGNVTVTSTDAGSAAAPELILYRNSASPDDGDYLGQIQFKGKQDAGGDEIYAKVTGKISDASQGTEDGLIETAIKGGGSFTIVSRQRSDELQLLNGCGLSVAGDATISGNLTVNGTTTTIDTAVTAVDSLAIDGAVTSSSAVVGSAVTINSSGINATGVITATSFIGDGSNLTGIDATQIVTGNTSVQTVDTGSDGHVKVTTEGTERLRINSSGNVGIGTNDPFNATGYKSITLAGSTGGAIAFREGATTRWEMYGDNTNGIRFYDRTNTTERLRITSGGNVRVPDSGKFTCGSSDDLKIYHNGTNNYIDANGDFYLRVNNGTETALYATANGKTALNYDNNNKFETTSTGATVNGTLVTSGTGGGAASLGSHLDLGDNQEARFGASDDLRIYHSGVNSHIQNFVGGLYIDQNLDNGDIHLRSDNSGGNLATYIQCVGSTGAVNIGHYGNTKLTTTTNGTQFTGGIGVNLAPSATYPIMTQAATRYQIGIRNTNADANYPWLVHDTVSSKSALVFHFNGVGDAARLTEDGKFVSNNYGSLGDFGGQFSQIRVGADVYGNTIKVVSDTNMNIAVNNGIYFNTGAATDGTTAGTNRAYINSTGFIPASNNAYDLGTSSLRWRNVYTNDLNLSNEGSTNDVDGTWGNYTIQEGEDDLFLINRRSGKKYKFMLQEVN